MSSSDFRHIAGRSENGRSERLFRAAVSAFCSLTRPSRREAAQLEDLTLPLFDAVPAETRRYVAAALSECHPAPAALVRRLADETIDVAAPLLIRSRALSDIDLIGLIGRHGLSHAHAIARRENLNPMIAKLIGLLDASVTAQSTQMENPAPMPLREPLPANPAVRNGELAENARQRLRAMMTPAHQDDKPQAVVRPLQGAETKLRETALTGNLAFFQTALADALEIDFRIAKSISEASGYAALSAALRALDFAEDKAFVVACALRPGLFTHPEAIKLFLGRYRMIHRDAAADALRGWKAESLALAMRHPRPTLVATPPQAVSAADIRRLKAS